MTTADLAPAGVRLRARWTGLASLGLALVAAGPLLLLIAVLAWRLDTEGETGFFLAIIGIAGLASFLVARFGTWAKVLGAVLGLMAAMALFWTAFGLFAPASFFEFLPGIFVAPGALLAVVSCVAAIVAKRRGHVGAAAEGGERKAIRVVVAVVALAAVASGLLTVVSRSTVADASGAAATAVLKDFEYSPTAYAVAGGSRILVRNNDPFQHTFTVDALGVDVTLTPGSAKLVTIPDRPGSYILYCRPHTEKPEAPKENDMAATLTVG